MLSVLNVEVTTIITLVILIVYKKKDIAQGQLVPLDNIVNYLKNILLDRDPKNTQKK